MKTGSECLYTFILKPKEIQKFDLFLTKAHFVKFFSKPHSNVFALNIVIKSSKWKNSLKNMPNNQLYTPVISERA